MLFTAAPHWTLVLGNPPKGEKEYSFESKLFLSTRTQHPTRFDVPSGLSPTKRSYAHSIISSRVDGQPIRITTSQQAYISGDNETTWSNDTTFCIFPQIEIVNLLPYDLEYEIVQLEESATSRVDFSVATEVNSRAGKICSGKKAQPAGLNLNASAYMRMRFVGASAWTEAVRVRVDYDRTCFLNQGIYPLKFHQGVHAQLEHQWDVALPTPKVICFAPIILSNLTGLNMSMYGKIRGRTTSTTSTFQTTLIAQRVWHFLLAICL